ncbi:unnamed protein product [Moneuplotes crassus]|uniref:Uncharacterized protein n=1 Tax=Euplotes crassus TaxID=5936 RepID=A0AAD1XC10_EUPCR|nr:unnamed protein product [Moneuplotes crassus]
MNSAFFSDEAFLFMQGHPDSVFAESFAQINQGWTDFGQTDFSLVRQNPWLKEAALEEVMELRPVSPTKCSDTKQVPSMKKSKVTRKSSTKSRRHRWNRSDLPKKAAFRFVRKFFHDLFKKQHPKIVKKRYVNCDVQTAIESMQRTISSVLSEELITEELTRFTVGILGIKKSYQLDCSNKVRDEIDQFWNTTQMFTIGGFNKCMKSKSFQTLCRCVVAQRKDSRAKILEESLLKY